MSEQMRNMMNLVEDTGEYNLEGRIRVVVSGVDSSDGYAIEDILDDYGQVHEAEIRGRDLVAFVTFNGINEDIVENAIAALGYNSVSFNVVMAEQLDAVNEAASDMVYVTMPGWSASEIAGLVSDLELDDEEHDMDNGVLYIAKKHVKDVIELALEYDDDTPEEAYTVSSKAAKQVNKQVVSNEVAKALKMLGYYYELTNRNLQVGGPFILRVLPKRIQLIGRDIEYVPRRRTDIEVDPQQIVDELNAIPGVEITLRKK